MQSIVWSKIIRWIDYSQKRMRIKPEKKLNDIQNKVLAKIKSLIKFLNKSKTVINYSS